MPPRRSSRKRAPVLLKPEPKAGKENPPQKKVKTTSNNKTTTAKVESQNDDDHPSLPHNKNSIDAYIAKFSPQIQTILTTIRQLIKELCVPPVEAIEKLSYKMPAFYVKNGTSPLVYYAAFTNHIGLYHTAITGDEALLQELKPYLGPKGNLKFPLNKPIPYPLIQRVVVARLGAATTMENTVVVPS